MRNNGLGAVNLAPTTKDFNSKLNCPHDFSHLEEIRDDLPTLLKRCPTTGKLKLDNQKQDTPLVRQSVPAFELFQNSSTTIKEEQQRWLNTRKESQTLRMPYKRYLAILPLMQEEKIAQSAREQSELLKRRLCPAEPAPANIKLEEGNIKEELDNLYNLPLKEQLKRKHQSPAPSTFKRSRNEENTKPSTSQTAQLFKSEKDSGTHKIEKVNDSDDDDVVEVPIEKKAPESKPSTLSKKQQKHQQKNNKRFKAKLRIPEQSSNRPVPTQSQQGTTQNFDYKNVDFRQFQGGAQRARGTEIKTQMRGKVSKIIWSFTIG